MSGITVLVIAGLLIMAFMVMGGPLSASTYVWLNESNGYRVTNESLTTVTGAGEATTVNSYRAVVLSNVIVINESNSKVINSANYSVTGGTITSITNGVYNNSDWNVTYTYTYLTDTQASNVVNNTLIAIGAVPGWFALLITMIMMVIIISLIALVILQVRASGIARGI